MTGSGVGATYDRTSATCCGCSTRRTSRSRPTTRAPAAPTSPRGGRLRRARTLHPLRAQREMRRGPQLIDGGRGGRHLDAAADEHRARSSCAARRRSPASARAPTASSRCGARHEPQHGRRRPDAAAGDAGRRGGRARRPAARNAPAQQLAGQAIDVELAPDGRRCRGSRRRTTCQLDLPAANPDAPTAANPVALARRATASPASPACTARASTATWSSARRRRRRRTAGVDRGPCPHARDQAAVRPRHHRRATFTGGVRLKDGTLDGAGADDDLRRRPGHDRAARAGRRHRLRAGRATSGSTSRRARIDVDARRHAHGRADATSRACSSPAPVAAGSKAVRAAPRC